jgi:hypothetical protein
MAFEILHGSFVRFGLFQRLKSPKVAALSSLYIFLARVQAILTRFQFTNHNHQPISLINKLRWLSSGFGVARKR